MIHDHMAHFFMIKSGSKFRDQLAHFFIDIHIPRQSDTQVDVLRMFYRRFTVGTRRVFRFLQQHPGYRT